MVEASSSLSPGGLGDYPSAMGRDAVAAYSRDDRDTLAWQPSSSGAYFGAMVRGVHEYDPAAFKVTVAEATLMDPQHRMLLAMTAQVLAQVPAGRCEGTFVGISSSDYGRLLGLYLRTVSPYAATGNALSVASGRLAFIFDRQGPAVSIDTACSSSLVGAHMARSGLKLGDCDVALVGGTNLTLTPDTCMVFKQAGMLAADGRCKTLDSLADGYGRGEACGALSIRGPGSTVPGRAGATPPLALMMVGSSVNQDGRSSALTAPNGPAQQRAIGAALQQGGCSAERLSQVQLHGTGTALGDPIEVGAVCQVVLAQGTGRREAALTLQAGKSSMGHTEPAAGVAGVLMLVHSLGQARALPVMHLQGASAHIHTSLESAPGRHPQSELPRQHAMAASRGGAGLVGGTSSFAFQGSNAHALVACQGEGAAAARGSAVKWGCRLQVWKLQKCWVAPLVHPLVQSVGHAVLRAEALEVCMEAALTRCSMAWLWDHRVAGQVLLPGAAYLEAAAALPGRIEQQGPPACVAACALVAPLVLPGAASGGPVTLLCRVDAASGTVAIGRRAAGVAQQGGAGGAPPVSTHMHGQVSARRHLHAGPGSAGGGQTAGMPSLELRRCRSTLPVHWGLVYGRLAAAGLQYGRSFQPVVGPVRCDPTVGAWGEVTSQPQGALQARDESVGAHPASLDGALQLGAMVHAGQFLAPPTGRDAEGRGVHVPAAAEAFCPGRPEGPLGGARAGALAASAALAQGRRWAPSGAPGQAAQVLVTDHVLSDSRGDGASVLVGLQARLMRGAPGPARTARSRPVAVPGAAPPAVAELYGLRWQTTAKAQLAKAGGPESRGGRGLSLVTRGGAGRAGGEHGGPPRGPSMAWAHWVPTGSRSTHSVPAFLQWAQGSLAARSEGVPLESVSATGPSLVPWGALPAAAGASSSAGRPVGGGCAMVHTFLQEGMGVSGAVVDTEEAAPGPAQRLGAAPEEAPGGTFMASMWAWRHGMQMQAVLGARSEERGLAARPALPVAAGRHAVVVGGLGALGSAVSAWMAEGGCGSLQLLGRSGRSGGQPPAGPSDARGGQPARLVQAVRANAARRQEAAVTASWARASAQAAHVCIHAGGVLADAMLAGQTAAGARRSFSPKAGTVVGLKEAGRGPATQLVAEVMFSSVASLLGSAGQFNYSGANAWLDACAALEAAKGLGCQSVQWGPWAGAGMASQHGGTAARLQRAGMGLVSPSQGLLALGSVLGAPARLQSRGPVQAALKVDWARFGALLPQVPAACEEVVGAARRASSALGAGAPGGAVSRAGARWGGLPLEERRQQVEQQLSDMVGGLLGREVEADEPLMEAGLDSMTAVELHGSVQETMGVELPATIMFDYPTVQALSGYIADGIVIDHSTEESVEKNFLDSGFTFVNESTKTLLFCFTFAGGIAESTFGDWNSRVHDWIQVVPIDVPGRGRRSNESESQSLKAIATDIAAFFRNSPLPYAIFAHSTGAILMYEVLALLHASGDTSKLLMAFPSGCPTPSAFEDFSKELFMKGFQTESQKASKSELLSALEGLLSVDYMKTNPDIVLNALEKSQVFSGIEKLRSNSALYNTIIPLIMNDISMILQYEFEPKDIFDCNLLCFKGAADSTYSNEAAKQWSNVTVGQVNIVEVNGDHFFITNTGTSEMILKKISSLLINSSIDRTPIGQYPVHNRVAFYVPEIFTKERLQFIDFILGGHVDRTFVLPQPSEVHSHDLYVHQMCKVDQHIPIVIIAEGTACLEVCTALDSLHARGRFVQVIFFRPLGTASSLRSPQFRTVIFKEADTHEGISQNAAVFRGDEQVDTTIVQLPRSKVGVRFQGSVSDVMHDDLRHQGLIRAALDHELSGGKNC